MDSRENGFCETHSRTLQEINDLKQENSKIRKELDEIKKAIQGFREFEGKVVANYQKRQRTLWHRLLNFFFGNNTKQGAK